MMRNSRVLTGPVRFKGQLRARSDPGPLHFDAQQDPPGTDARSNHP